MEFARSTRFPQKLWIKRVSKFFPAVRLGFQAALAAQTIRWAGMEMAKYIVDYKREKKMERFCRNRRWRSRNA